MFDNNSVTSQTQSRNTAPIKRCVTVSAQLKFTVACNFRVLAKIDFDAICLWAVMHLVLDC